MKAGVVPVPDRRHRLRFGKNLCVRSNPDFQVLRPESLLNQKLLQRSGLPASRFQLIQRLANRGDDFTSNGGRLLRITARLLFNDPFQQAHGKRHPGSFNSLQVNWGKQPRFARITLIRWRISQQFVKRADGFSGNSGDAGGR